jgi:hypothetical protein
MGVHAATVRVRRVTNARTECANTTIFPRGENVLMDLGDVEVKGGNRDGGEDKI